MEKLYTWGKDEQVSVFIRLGFFPKYLKVNGLFTSKSIRVPMGTKKLQPIL